MTAPASPPEASRRAILYSALIVAAVPVGTLFWVAAGLRSGSPLFEGSLNWVLPLQCLAAWGAIGWFLVRAPVSWPLRVLLWLGFGFLVLVSAFVALAALFWNVR
ncbi:hypothetical protein FBQ97_18890 [Acidobacteria bacterium ACD]|nr:MAG: hypothetical protein EDX89_19055 [Acidobacteriota bacterium]MCE7959038.1 hypothetical protein [Acidobacteria bacterium ACB2]MDL1951856.1 hypothetical protein [Acidobacteria bacterium ACD]